VLRTAATLLAADVPLARVRRSLAALVRELRPSAALGPAHLGGRQERCGSGRRNGLGTETGQALLDFELDGIAQQVAELRPPTRRRARPTRRRRAPAPTSSARSISRTTTPRRLRRLRPRARARSGSGRRVVNLGRIAHESGNASEPCACTTRRSRAARGPGGPLQPRARARRRARPRARAAHYERALALDPSFADAHFNLASVCEKLERKADALRHYHAYKKLTSG